MEASIKGFINQVFNRANTCCYATSQKWLQ